LKSEPEKRDNKIREALLREPERRGMKGGMNHNGGKKKNPQKGGAMEIAERGKGGRKE